MKGYIFSRRTMQCTLIYIIFLPLLISFAGCGGPLYRAALRGDTTLLETASETDIDEQQALIGAVQGGNPEVVRFLIEKGADVNLVDGTGWTPLGVAAYAGNANIVRILLDSGADVNRGNGALEWAVRRGRTEAARVLIDAGADIDDDYLNIAQSRGYTIIAQMLQRAVEERYSIGRKSASLAIEPAPGRKQYTPKAAPEKRRPLYTVPSSQQVRDVSQRWAVIVGISNYHDSRIPSLRYASADAQSFYRWLTSAEGGRVPPSRVKLLINEEATGRNIKQALFVWLKQAIEEDLVIIFFAGHGSPESPDYPDNLFLLPYDAQYDNIATTGFPMWDVETALKRFVQAKKVVVMADACHAGGVGQAFEVARRANRAIQVNPISSGLHNLSRIGDGVCVISGSDDKQFSQESRDWGGGHGVFTYFLLEGLNGQADYNMDNRVTLGELIPYLSEQVRRETRNAQSPTVAGKFDPALSIAR